MLLNPTYYQDLWHKYKDFNPLYVNFNDNFSTLNFGLIVDRYKNGQPIHINFQCSDAPLSKIGQNLFVELANTIYLNYPDLPPSFEPGQRLKRKFDNKYYRITHVNNSHYTLKEDPRKGSKSEANNTILPRLTYDAIAKHFVEVAAGISEKTINNYINFFKSINNHKTDFLQTYFERKSVFVAPKLFYDSLEIKNKVPTTYFPNPREDHGVHETKSIPALPDSIMYFVSKYKTCHERILLTGKKIDTVVLFNTDEEELAQIIQDKNRYGFNLIILTHAAVPVKCSQIPCWNWFKEERELINSL